MTMNGIVGIDPGNVYTGIAVIDKDYKPIAFSKTENNELLEWLETNRNWLPKKVCVEMVASYGMAVGQTVFDTCVWIGRFAQFFDERGFTVSFVKRKTYVVDFCGTAKAKDANVTQYLVDRFAADVPNHGKGNKKEPGWFYGFAKDVWSAYAIATWAMDEERRNHGN